MLHQVPIGALVRLGLAGPWGEACTAPVVWGEAGRGDATAIRVGDRALLLRHDGEQIDALVRRAAAMYGTSLPFVLVYA